MCLQTSEHFGTSVSASSDSCFFSYFPATSISGFTCECVKSFQRMNERWKIHLVGTSVAMKLYLHPVPGLYQEREILGWFCQNILALNHTSCPWIVAEAPISLVWLFSMSWNCETQPSSFHRLSSPIFHCSFVVVRPSRIGDISTYLHYMMF